MSEVVVIDKLDDGCYRKTSAIAGMLKGDGSLWFNDFDCNS